MHEMDSISLNTFVFTGRLKQGITGILGRFNREVQISKYVLDGVIRG